MGARVPFGPFLAIAAFEYVLIPEQIAALVALVAALSGGDIGPGHGHPAAA
jgi:prepilin signal peptidase PulO-like enzyme (type II secretory pathway)